MIGRMLRVAVIAIALAGCRDKRLDELKAVRDEVCACRDVACGEAALKKRPEADGTPGHRAQQLASEMVTCLSKLYLKERPDENPDEPTPPEPAPPEPAPR